MAGWEKGRRVSLKVLYDGTDISVDVADYLSSFSYTDNTDDKADDLQIELEDRNGNWSGSWMPEIRTETTETTTVSTPPTSSVSGYEDITGGSSGTKEVTATSAKAGSKLTASIIVENWENSGTKEQLPCGTFEIDGLTLKGPPDTVTIKAVSVPQTSKLRNQHNTRAWEEVTLSQVASALASANGMALNFQSSEDPEYDRLDQLETADMAYLQSLCKDAGLSLKATGTEIVIFSQKEYEAKASSFTLKRGEQKIISYNFDVKTNDTYSKATVVYRDPKTNQIATNTFAAPNAGADERPELIINARPSKLPEVEKQPRQALKNPRSGSAARAAAVSPTTASKYEDILSTKAKDTTKKQAQNALREKNKNENKVQFTLVGDVNICGGITFDVSGWNNFDGKYIIETAKHAVNNSGYIVNITAHKCLEGY